MKPVKDQDLLQIQNIIKWAWKRVHGDQPNLPVIALLLSGHSLDIPPLLELGEEVGLVVPPGDEELSRSASLSLSAISVSSVSVSSRLSCSRSQEFIAITID